VPQSPAKPLAYSYVRFSTPEQAKGDSFRRQTEAAQRYALEHGLELDDRLTFRDLGVSGFRGKNADSGQLGDFRRAVEEGLVAEGSYLLVENLDRISRQNASDATYLLQGIVRSGVVVVTLSDGRKFSKAELEHDALGLVMAVLSFMRSHDESETKSRRLKAAWAAKRSRIGDRPLTSRLPAWVRLNAATQKLELDAKKAAVVRRVYELAATGMGQASIAETLNREEVPTFGDGKRKAAFWHKSYVTKLLESDAPSGTFTPHRLEHIDGKRTRVPEAAVLNYFPPVIPTELLERVRSLSGAKPRHRTNSPTAIATFLASTMRCGQCGSAMLRVNKGAKSGGRPYVVCSRARAKAMNPRCTMPNMKLFPWELSVASYFANEARDVPEGTNAELEVELAEVVARRSVVDVELEQLTENLGRVKASARVAQRITRHEAELAELERRSKDLWKRLAETSSRLVSRNMTELKDHFTAELDALPELTPDALEGLDRVKANALIRRAVDRIVLKSDMTFAVHWKHGVVSEGEPFSGFLFPAA
jgi:DNA invertase Pin-like site-specific DNA recombinase